MVLLLTELGEREPTVWRRGGIVVFIGYSESIRLLFCLDLGTCRYRAGEGNGTPLRCSCLENPGDGGAWWAAVYGITQSVTEVT